MSICLYADDIIKRLLLADHKSTVRHPVSFMQVAAFKAHNSAQHLDEAVNAHTVAQNLSKMDVVPHSHGAGSRIALTDLF